MKLFSSEQSRDWDQYTIDYEPIASIELMERAAYKCSYWLLKKYSNGFKPIVFCGVGNNGGDGLAIARQLRDRGFFPKVYVVNFSSKRSNEFSKNLERLKAREVPVYDINSETDLVGLTIKKEEIVIDAIFGSGLNRHAVGVSELLISKINMADSEVISIDLPSGMINKIPGDERQGSIIRANYTLSFESLKLPFLFKETGIFVGNPVVLSIGLHPEFYKTTSSKFEFVLGSELKDKLKKRERFSHKGSYGHSMIIAGSYGKMGAAVLCAKACLRMGSGLVTIHAPLCGINTLQSSIPEAMVLPNCGKKYLDGEFIETGNILAIGPGIGQEENTVKFLHNLFLKINEPIIIDADALNIIAHNQEHKAFIPIGSILTPHPKELERLVGTWRNEEEKIEKLTKLSLEINSYVLLKGAYSIVACPDGKICFNSTGNPGMATAGSGDVLTGVVAGLLSQGYTALDSAVLGMYIHGLAGDIATEELGERSLIAGDIINRLSPAILSIQKVVHL